jgi:hypothetical protein
MRKLAPAFVLSSLVALASGSAFALGDMNKNKKSPNADAATPQSSNTATRSDMAPPPNAGTERSGASASNSHSGNSGYLASGKKDNRAACRNLKPADAAWAQNDCNSVTNGTSAAATGSGTSGASTGAAATPSSGARLSGGASSPGAGASGASGSGASGSSGAGGSSGSSSSASGGSGG